MVSFTCTPDVFDAELRRLCVVASTDDTVTYAKEVHIFGEFPHEGKLRSLRSVTGKKAKTESGRNCAVM